MTFNEIVEHAKNGLGKPNFVFQSEQLAWLTVRNLLLAYRNQLVPRDEVLEQKIQAEKLFEQARQEEVNRLLVYQNHLKQIRSCEELIHQINHEMKNENPDKQLLLTLMAQVVDNCFGTGYGGKL